MTKSHGSFFSRQLTPLTVQFVHTCGFSSFPKWQGADNQVFHINTENPLLIFAQSVNQKYNINMNEQLICFFILGVGPVMSLAISLIVEIIMKNRKGK